MIKNDVLKEVCIWIDWCLKKKLTPLLWTCSSLQCPHLHLRPDACWWIQQCSSGQSPASNTFQSVTQLLSNRNQQVKTNMWQYAIIGTNWTTLYIQIFCLLSTSRHINNLSSDRSALSDISANELVSAVCQRWKPEKSRREVKVVFAFCNCSRKFS